MSKIYVLTGPTGTRKTKLAIDLAKKIDGFIINCDSRQMYRGLDHLTGKDIPTGSTYKQEHSIKISSVNYEIGYHHLKDGSDIWLTQVADVSDPISITIFSKVLRKTLSLTNQNKIPILVGGSWLYLKHLLVPMPYSQIKINHKLRKNLESSSVSQLQSMLIALNNDVFLEMNQSDQYNPARLVRKIEIENFLQENKILPNHFPLLFKSNLQLYLTSFPQNIDVYKQKLYQRVEARFDLAVGEINKLLQEHHDLSSPGLSAIGVAQIISFLEGKITREEAMREWMSEDFAYSKRQWTFMQKDLIKLPIIAPKLISIIDND